MEKIVLTWSKIDTLDSAKVNSVASNLAGVYRLSYRHEDSNIYVFYVGEGEDIKKQLLSHISEGEQRVCVKNFIALKPCFFKYAPVPDPTIRNLVYRQICKFYQPSCNDDKTTGDDIIELNVN
ncbi:MAG TPA: hypothetical protein VGQ59_22015 [Cyclobacteriaceae bacterium]|nr:hypothetical protein [Cyclobacteriaceae bacterium]